VPVLAGLPQTATRHAHPTSRRAEQRSLTTVTAEAEIGMVATMTCQHTPHGDGRHCACWQQFDDPCCYCAADPMNERRRFALRVGPHSPYMPGPAVSLPLTAPGALNDESAVSAN
jgi:hypothetical protein